MLQILDFLNTSIEEIHPSEPEPKTVADTERLLQRGSFREVLTASLIQRAYRELPTEKLLQRGNFEIVA